MKKNWFVVGLVSLVVLGLLFGAGMWMGGWGYRGWGMMGPGGMMGGWGFSPFGWFGMLFMWLIPVGLVVLATLGVSSILQNNGHSAQTGAQTACPNCKKNTQADWQNCPYCGAALK
ncbi:MAG: hypothetical protein Fur0035_11130 [Anaerolineales bacterium]